jgi:hypothetical protein
MYSVKKCDGIEFENLPEFVSCLVVFRATVTRAKEHMRLNVVQGANKNMTC